VSTRRLNVFQRLARTWDSVHPYNAGQACLARGAFETGVLDGAWNAALGAFSFHSVPPQRVDAVLDDLPAHYETELNRGFASDGLPFRAFAKGGGGSTWLGITYRHWAADSFSVRRLLREWLGRLVDVPATPDVTTRRRPSGRRAPPFSLLRRYADFRRTRKVQTMGPLDYPTRVRLLDVRSAAVPNLIAYARRHGVTLNDVLVASLAQACDRLVPTELRPGRRNLAIGSVVDLRSSDDLDFGCRLGFSSVICRASELAGWDGLLRAVACRREPRDAAGQLWMRAAEFASRFTPPERAYDFYRKEVPFAGGISNVNLDETWVGALHPHTVSDYIRISPTGPMVPVALNVTTLGGRLRVSMTYRAALFNDWTAKELGDMFADRLTRIAVGND
jgi:hypothetical protein